MAFTSRHFDTSASAVFATLIEPRTYPQWLIGADRIKQVDGDWPAIGSSFRHVVGVGPLKISDRTHVVDIDPGRMLTLKVRARPFIWAIATFRVVGGDDGCVVTLQEEPAIRWLGNLVRPVLDPTVHIRNHRSLRRLAAVVDGEPGRMTARS